MTDLLAGARVDVLGPEDVDLLRTLVAAEAVVPVRSPRELERRLAPDRRVLAVRHADGAPLCFVHVALTERFPSSLDEATAGPPVTGEPRFATFFGITRTDPRARGQAGRLLKMALEHVLAESPSVQVAATLSPMPGFRPWAERCLELLKGEQAAEDVEGLARACAAGLAKPEQLRALRRVAELWLLTKDERGRVQDPVARFHLGNGAHVRDVLVGADGSWHGLEQSLGVMVSYQYVPADAPSVEVA